MRRHRLLLGALLVLAAACAGGEKAESNPPVIIVSIDTLRADHLPVYGYRGVDTPAIDQFRRDSILFTNAWSHSPLTLPSHVALLTGTLPYENGVRNNIGYRYEAENHPSISKVLKGQGYETGAAVSAYVLRGSTGLREAFDFYDDKIANRPGVAVGQLFRDGETTAGIARQWITPRAAKSLFFFLHLFEPHSPYEPPEEFRNRYANPYDGEIAAADAILGRFFAFLKEQKLYDRSLIIVLSDHGEGLGDHGEDEHGIFLYREAIHVPLIVKLPNNRRAGETAAHPVQLIDVAPTIAEIANVRMPGAGRSLLAQPQARSIYSETLFPRLHLGWSELRSLVNDDYHYIDAPRAELYDVRRDLREERNVIAENRRVASAMRSELEPTKRAAQSPAAISPEEAAKFAALGYVGAASISEANPSIDPKDHIGEINLMKDGARHAALGRYGQAIAAYRSVVEANPGFSDAWNKLALTYEEVGLQEEALAAYKEALRRSPRLASEYALSIGSLLMRMKRYDDAIRHTELAATQNRAGAELLLARIAHAQRRFDVAEKHGRAAMPDSAYAPAAAVLVGRILTDGGRADEAIRFLDESKSRFGSAIEGLELARGSALAQSGRAPEAEAAFRAEIAAFPASLEAYTNLAVICMISGRNGEAESVLAKMIENNPTPRAYRVAASAAEAFGQTSSAARLRSRADAMATQ